MELLPSKGRNWLAYALIAILAVFTAYQATKLRATQLESQKAKATKELWREFVEHSRQAIILADRNGLIIDWNMGASEMFGWSREEVIGQPITIVMPFAEQRRHNDAICNPARAQPILDGHISEIKCLAAHRDGRTIPILIRLQGARVDVPVFVAQIQREELIQRIDVNTMTSTRP